jgi:hypothetical protein
MPADAALAPAQAAAAPAELPAAAAADKQGDGSDF